MTLRRIEAGFGQAIDTISNIGGWLAMVLTLIIAALVFISVTARYVFSRPILYLDELVGYMFLAMVFFGLGYAFKQEAQIRVDVVISRLSPRARQVLLKISYSLALIWGITLVFGLWQLCSRFYTLNINSGTTLAAPLWIPILAVLVGAIMMTLQVAASLLSRKDKSSGPP